MIGGPLGNSYEPTYQWLMPLALIGLGAAVGRWNVLWLAAIPVALASPDGTSGDPPEVPSAMMLSFGVATALAAGVGLSRLAEASLGTSNG